MILLTYIYTYTHTHTLIWCLRGFLAACWTCTPGRARQSPPFQSLKCLGCCSFTSTAPALRCTARHWLHCTGTTSWDWTGWRRWAWLPSVRASERAKRLSYCAARLVSLSLSHHWASVHFQISTHWVPPSIPSRLPTPPPQTRLRHLSLPLFLSHNVECISAQT